MTGTEIYKRSSTFDGEAETIRLHAPQWKLLLAFDGQRSLAEVAISVEMAFAEALPLTQVFLDHDWIEEQPITLEQYLKRTGAPTASPVGAAVTPSVVLHQAKPESPMVAPSPRPVPAPAPIMAPPAHPLSSVASAPAAAEIMPPPRAPITAPPAPLAAKPTLPPPLKAQPSPAAAVITPPAPPLAQAARGSGPMRLKAVVDFIVSQVGNSSLGQLVVYRVFLRVPPQLLQAEDIASVHLINDQSVVKTDSLKQAIGHSVIEVLKRPLPESVFASA